MQYKTMVLELIQQRPELYEQLRSQRLLLPAINNYAHELKTLHQDWMEILSQANPQSVPPQIASESLERALQALEDFLPAASPPDEDEPLSLDAAMAFLRRHTLPA